MIPTSRNKTTLLLLLAVSLLCIILLAGTAPKGATAVSPSNNLPEGWIVECVDCLHYFTGMSGSSAALDQNGLVHTAYGGDGLYYATQNPDDTFHIEVVDDNPYRGVNASMVLDSSDRPHILYYAEDLLRLNYAHFDGSQWHIETLPTADLTALPHPWLDIDDSDNLHVAFIDGDVLIYGLYDGHSWQFTTVDTDVSGNIGRPSLDLDSSSRPHIAYGRGGKYAYFDGLDWQIITFSGTYDQGESIALTLDQNNYPHIAYQTEFNGYDGLDLRYRHYDGINWHVENVDNGDLVLDLNTGYDLSLILDNANQPVFNYTVQTSNVSPYPYVLSYILRVVRRGPGPSGWEFINLYCCPGSLEETHYTTMLAGQGNDLIFVHKLSRYLVLAVMTDQSFTTTAIDDGGASGTHIDLTVDNKDRLHLVAHEIENDRLRYGLKENGAWSVETLANNAGWFASEWLSMALTSDNRPYVMYDHYSRYGQLFFLYNDGQAWQYLEYEDHRPRTFEVEMDSNDNLHVAFYDYHYNHVSHFSIDQAGNLSEIDKVDPRFTRGEIDIALDTADYPHIVYPTNNHGLRYAVQTPSGWLSQTIVPVRTDYPSIALDRYDHPHIAWYDTVQQDLRYGYYDGTDWQIVTLDSNGDVGQYASLVIDRIGRAFISYYDADNGDLKYATYDGTTWITTTLLSEGDVGSYSSLAMPFAGYPAIAYYDAVTRDLMMVYRPFQPTNFAYLPLLPAK